MIKGLDRMPPRARANLCIAINQLAFPGLGTILMHRPAGWLQAALMVSGFVLVTGFASRVIVCAIRYMANPTWDEADFRATYQAYQWALRYGLAFCAVAWLGALFSSIGIWRRARSHPPVLP